MKTLNYVVLAVASFVLSAGIVACSDESGSPTSPSAVPAPSAGAAPGAFRPASSGRVQPAAFDAETLRPDGGNTAFNAYDQPAAGNRRPRVHDIAEKTWFPRQVLAGAGALRIWVTDPDCGGRQVVVDCAVDVRVTVSHIGNDRPVHLNDLGLRLARPRSEDPFDLGGLLVGTFLPGCYGYPGCHYYNYRFTVTATDGNLSSPVEHFTVRVGESPRDGEFEFTPSDASERLIQVKPGARVSFDVSVRDRNPDNLVRLEVRGVSRYSHSPVESESGLAVSDFTARTGISVATVCPARMPSYVNCGTLRFSGTVLAHASSAEEDWDFDLMAEDGYRNTEGFRFRITVQPSE